MNKNKEWLVVHRFTNAESQQVGYFSKTDAETICMHFIQYCCDLIVINKGNVYRLKGMKLKRDECDE